MRYLIILLFAFAACKTAPPVVSSNTFDSTMMSFTPRVDTFWLPGEVVEIPGIQIECDSTTNKPKPVTAVVKGKRITVRTSINKNGLLTTKATCDSLMEVVTLQDKLIFRLRTENKVTQLPPITTHAPYWFDTVFRWWALISALILGWKYRKGFISLLGKLAR